MRVLGSFACVALVLASEDSESCSETQSLLQTRHNTRKAQDTTDAQYSVGTGLKIDEAGTTSQATHTDTPVAGHYSSSHTGHYLDGYAAGDSTIRPLSEAQLVCDQLGDSCSGITCSSETSCTVRVGSVLRGSPVGEFSFLKAPCDVDACFARCEQSYGGTVGSGTLDDTYYCAKGCALMSGGFVNDRDLYCDMNAPDRVQNCLSTVAGCSSDSSNRLLCARGCEWWSEWTPPADTSLGSNPQADTKCPHNHEDRLFKAPSSGSSSITRAACFAQCQATAGCNHYSWGQGANGDNFVCMGCTTLDNAQHQSGFASYDMPADTSVGSNPQADTKCPHNHEDRLFRAPSSGSSSITRLACFAQCQATEGCNHYSWGQGVNGDHFVCMGCTTLDNAQHQRGFTAYDMPAADPDAYDMAAMDALIVGRTTDHYDARMS